MTQSAYPSAFISLLSVISYLLFFFRAFVLVFHLLTYLLTYLLTPWNRVLLESLTGSVASQEIPRILWNPKIH
jgi:predicted membrane protein